MACDQESDKELVAEDLIEAAERLGFAMSPCGPCEPVIDPGCANCEGFGFVWQSGGATLARSGMVLLARAARARSS